MEIQAAKVADHPETLETCEASVRATHDFLADEDIEFLRPAARAQGRPSPIPHMVLRPAEKAPSRRGRLQCLLLMWLGAQLAVGCAASEEPGPWQAIELGTSAEFRDIFFLDARRGWMVGAAGVRNPGGILATTTDGGESWEYRTGLVGPRSGSTSVDLSAVVFLDSLRGVIVGESGTVLRTEDGGEHWRTIPPTGPIYAHHQDIDFVDADHGWIVGRNGVLRTENAGESWERVDEGRDVTGQAIDFVDLERGWVVGKNAAVYQSRDGGTSWERIQVLADPSRSRDQNSPNFTSVCFVDDQNGWIAGYQREFPGFEQHDRAIIVHTDDGGLHWTEQLHEVESLLTAIAFTDVDHGWAAGYNVNDSSGRLMYTADGGSSWSTQATVEGGTLKALALRDGKAWTVGRRIGAEPQRLWRFAPAAQGIGEVEGSH